MANEQLEKYLKLARRAREENNSEDAKRYYDMVRTEDPDNVEARYFYAYYRVWDGKKGECYGNFVDFCKVFSTVVRSVSEWEVEMSEKESLIQAILPSASGMVLSVRKIQTELWEASSKAQNTTDANKYNGQKKKVEKSGIEMMYALGDDIAKYFADNETLKAVKLSAWKKGAEFNQQFPYCGIDKTAIETYVAKIKQIEPSYEPPKKAGCISFG